MFTMDVSFVLLCFIINLLLYFLWTRRRFYKVAYQLPGPLGLPFLGVGLNMMNPETFLQYMENISKKYTTPCISWMGTNCFLYVNDPETVETIFNSPHCTNKGDFYRFMASAIGDGLFTSSSPRWNKHRRLINPAFSRQTINNFLLIFNAEADVLLDKLYTDGLNGNWLEIYGILKKSVLETACQTTMGKKMNFQNDGSALIFESYNGITEVCVKRMLSPWLYTDIIYRLSPLFHRQIKVVGILFGFVEDLLKRTSQTKNEIEKDETNEGNSSNCNTNKKNNINNNDDGGDNDIVVDDNDADDNDDKNATNDATDVDIGKSKAIFIEQVRNFVDQGQLSWDDVRDEANVIIAATFETTSTALYLVCLCLAMHPQYQDKLYEELVELFPDDGENNEITTEHLNRMIYTEMVINEAMRLFAPVPMVLRSASADFPLRNGVVIPQGTQIGIDIFNMQRSIDVWGANAQRFRPDEHFGPNSPMAKSSFAFIPFTKGLRMCIGYKYALMLMKVMIAKIFRNFRLHTDATIDDLIIKGTISLKLREYPLCQVIPRRVSTQ